MPKTYRFAAELERFEGKGAWYYLLYPNAVEKEFGTKGRLRVLGTMNLPGRQAGRISGKKVKVDRALIPQGDGTHVVILGGELRKQLGVSLGDTIEMEFHVNPDPDAIDVPEELEIALEMEPELKPVYERQTPGTKRGISYWINSGKRPETRAKRAAEMMRRFASGAFAFGGKKGKS